VVDDEPAVAHSLAVLLRLLGHEVEIAHDGLEAIAAAERYRPDVLLLDIGMPELDGYGSLRLSHATPGRPNAAVMRRLAAKSGACAPDLRSDQSAAHFLQTCIFDMSWSGAVNWPW
jgi:CheY-like chemotaxis protein